MAGRMARCGREPDCVVKLKIVIDEQRLTRSDYRFAVESPHIFRRRTRWQNSALARLFPCRIFAFVEHVLGVRESWHPAAISQHGIPAAMVDMQVGAEYVIDIPDVQSGCGKVIEPRVFREIPRWPIAFILTCAGIDQDRV